MVAVLVVVVQWVAVAVVLVASCLIRPCAGNGLAPSLWWLLLLMFSLLSRAA